MVVTKENKHVKIKAFFFTMLAVLGVLFCGHTMTGGGPLSLSFIGTVYADDDSKDSFEDDFDVSFNAWDQRASLYMDRVRSDSDVAQRGDTKDAGNPGGFMGYMPRDAKFWESVAGTIKGWLGISDTKSDSSWDFNSINETFGAEGTKYWALGRMMQSLGYDEVHNSGPNILRSLFGIITLFAVVLASAVSYIFDIMFKILDFANPFKFFSQSSTLGEVGYGDPGTIGSGWGGRDATPLFQFFSKTYDSFAQFAFEVVIPFTFMMLLIGFFLIRSYRSSFGHHLKQFLIRAAFIIIGIPLLGSLYTQALDRLAGSFTMDGTYVGTIVAHTFFDFSSFIESGGGNGMPTKIGNAEPNTVTSKKDDTVKSGDVTNVRNNCFMSNQQACSALADSPYVDTSHASMQMTDSFDALGNGSGARESGDAMEYAWRLVSNYYFLDMYTGATWESHWKSRQSAFTNEMLGKLYISTFRFAFDEPGNSAVPEDKHFVPSKYNPAGGGSAGGDAVEVQGRGAYWTHLSGSSFNIFNNGDGSHLSTMATYNFLNSEFNDNGLKVYEASAPSSYSKKTHYSVVLVGHGIMMKFVLVFNAWVMLFGYVILACAFVFKTAVHAIFNGFDVMAEALFASIGMYKAIARCIMAALSTIVEVFISLLFFSIATELMYHISYMVDEISQSSTGYGSGAFEGSLGLTISVLLATVMEIFFIKFCIQWRGSIVKAFQDNVKEVIEKAMGVSMGAGMGASAAAGSVGGQMAASGMKKGAALGNAALAAGTGAAALGAAALHHGANAKADKDEEKKQANELPGGDGVPGADGQGAGADKAANANNSENNQTNIDGAPAGAVDIDEQAAEEAAKAEARGDEPGAAGGAGDGGSASGGDGESGGDGKGGDGEGGQAGAPGAVVAGAAGAGGAGSSTETSTETETSEEGGNGEGEGEGSGESGDGADGADAQSAAAEGAERADASSAVVNGDAIINGGIQGGEGSDKTGAEAGAAGADGTSGEGGDGADGTRAGADKAADAEAAETGTRRAAVTAGMANEDGTTSEHLSANLSHAEREAAQAQREQRAMQAFGAAGDALKSGFGGGIGDSVRRIFGEDNSGVAGSIGAAALTAGIAAGAADAASITRATSASNPYSGENLAAARNSAMGIGMAAADEKAALAQANLDAARANLYDENGKPKTEKHSYVDKKGNIVTETKNPANGDSTVTTQSKNGDIKSEGITHDAKGNAITTKSEYDAATGTTHTESANAALGVKTTSDIAADGSTTTTTKTPNSRHELTTNANGEVLHESSSQKTAKGSESYTNDAVLDENGNVTGHVETSTRSTGAILGIKGATTKTFTSNDGSSASFTGKKGSDPAAGVKTNEDGSLARDEDGNIIAANGKSIKSAADVPAGVAMSETHKTADGGSVSIKTGVDKHGNTTLAETTTADANGNQHIERTQAGENGSTVKTDITTDAHGNITGGTVTTKNDKTHAASTTKYNADGSSSTESVSHDAQGYEVKESMTKAADGSTTYTVTGTSYDSAGKPSGRGTTTVKKDANGNVVSQTETMYETDGSGNAVRDAEGNPKVASQSVKTVAADGSSVTQTTSNVVGSDGKTHQVNQATVKGADGSTTTYNYDSAKAMGNAVVSGNMAAAATGSVSTRTDADGSKHVVSTGADGSSHETITSSDGTVRKTVDVVGNQTVEQTTNAKTGTTQQVITNNDTGEKSVIQTTPNKDGGSSEVIATQTADGGVRTVKTETLSDGSRMVSVMQTSANGGAPVTASYSVGSDGKVTIPTTDGNDKNLQAMGISVSQSGGQTVESLGGVNRTMTVSQGITTVNTTGGGFNYTNSVDHNTDSAMSGKTVSSSANYGVDASGKAAVTQSMQVVGSEGVTRYSSTGGGGVSQQATFDMSAGKAGAGSMVSTDAVGSTTKVSGEHSVVMGGASGATVSQVQFANGNVQTTSQAYNGKTEVSGTTMSGEAINGTMFRNGSVKAMTTQSASGYTVSVSNSGNGATTSIGSGGMMSEKIVSDAGGNAVSYRGTSIDGSKSGMARSNGSTTVASYNAVTGEQIKDVVSSDGAHVTRTITNAAAGTQTVQQISNGRVVSAAVTNAVTGESSKTSYMASGDVVSQQSGHLGLKTATHVERADGSTYDRVATPMRTVAQSQGPSGRAYSVQDNATGSYQASSVTRGGSMQNVQVNGMSGTTSVININPAGGVSGAAVNAAGAYNAVSGSMSQMQVHQMQQVAGTPTSGNVQLTAGSVQVVGAQGGRDSVMLQGGSSVGASTIILPGMQQAAQAGQTVNLGVGGSNVYMQGAAPAGGNQTVNVGGANIGGSSVYMQGGQAGQTILQGVQGGNPTVNVAAGAPQAGPAGQTIILPGSQGAAQAGAQTVNVGGANVQVNGGGQAGGPSIIGGASVSVQNGGQNISVQGGPSGGQNINVSAPAGGGQAASFSQVLNQQSNTSFQSMQQFAGAQHYAQQSVMQAAAAGIPASVGNNSVTINQQQAMGARTGAGGPTVIGGAVPRGMSAGSVVINNVTNNYAGSGSGSHGPAAAGATNIHVQAQGGAAPRVGGSGGNAGIGGGQHNPLNVMMNAGSAATARVAGATPRYDSGSVGGTIRSRTFGSHYDPVTRREVANSGVTTPGRAIGRAVNGADSAHRSMAAAMAGTTASIAAGRAVRRQQAIDLATGLNPTMNGGSVSAGSQRRYMQGDNVLGGAQPQSGSAGDGVSRAELEREARRIAREEFDAQRGRYMPPPPPPPGV